MLPQQDFLTQAAGSQPRWRTYSKMAGLPVDLGLLGQTGVSNTVGTSKL